MKSSKYMPLTILLLQLLLLSLPITHTGCNTNDPVVEEYVEPGSRNYEWTIDTLKIPFNILTRIWGSSPADVWATGGGGGMDKTIWHFDGTKWSTDYISRPIVPTSIFGFGTDDVWLGGNQGLIWHYNGSTWSQHTKFEIPGYPYTGLENTWGDSPDNVYSVGYAADGKSYKGIIFHYDGKKWQEVKIPSIKISFIKIRRAKNESPNYYLLGLTSNLSDVDSTRIYEFDGKNIKEINSGIANSEQYGGIELFDGKIYFRKGRGIYKYENGYFNLEVQFDEQNFKYPLVGRNIKDIFLNMSDGIAHYNGTDIKYLVNFSHSGISISGSLVFDTQVFFMAVDINNGQNYMFKGKLLEENYKE